MEHTTLCYIHSSTRLESPPHIRQLWNEKIPQLDSLRYQGQKLFYPTSTKEWIKKLAPTAQAKLWNNSKLDTDCKPDVFKINNKLPYLATYDQEDSHGSDKV